MSVYVLSLSFKIRAKNKPVVGIDNGGWQNAVKFVQKIETKRMFWEKRLNASRDAKTRYQASPVPARPWTVRDFCLVSEYVRLCYLPIDGLARQPWELGWDHDTCPDARTGPDIILPHGEMQEATMEHDGFSFANTDGDMETRLKAC